MVISKINNYLSYSRRLVLRNEAQQILCVLLVGLRKLSTNLHSLIIGLLLLLIISSNSYADVRAFLNQNSTYTGDPVSLTIEATGGSNGQPDFAPLEKAFDILGTSNSSQMSIINGRSSSKKSWVVRLQPKSIGKIEIPAISVGSEKTAPLTLTVGDIPPELKAQIGKHVFVEASVALKNPKPYVQQQIPYTVKLFYDERLINYQMFPPNIENAIIEEVDKKDRYQVTKNGKTYTVIERNYVISPEKSGSLTIPPAIVKGEIKDPNTEQQARQNGRRSRDPFQNDPFFSDFFSSSAFRNPGKPITLRSNAIEVEVKTLATAFTGKDWLPAEDIIIVDSWAKQPPILRVGEPATRTLSVQAKGLASSQIPTLELPQPKNARLYADQAVLETYTDGSTLIGVSKQSITYIPNAEGELLVPDIKLDWWNVETQQQQSFVLPGMALSILPGAAGSKVQSSTQIKPAPLTEQSQNTGTDKNQFPDDVTATEKPHQKFPLWIVITLLSFMGLVFLAFKYRKKVFKKADFTRSKPLIIKHKSSTKQKVILGDLQQACKENNPQQAAHLLLQLLQSQWTDKPPQNLGIAAKQLAVGSEIVEELSYQLYAEDTNSWKGEKLWGLVKEGLQRRVAQATQKDDGVNALYPDRN